MNGTYTTSYETTYTEARALLATLSVLADLIVFANIGMITSETAKDWISDLRYLMKAQVLKYFELQCYSTHGNRIGGYRFVVSGDGSLHENSLSGGIDPYDFPTGTKIKLFADVDYTKRNNDEVRRYLEEHGWGTNGSALEGQLSYERAYSKDGYGLQRYKVTL